MGLLESVGQLSRGLTQNGEVPQECVAALSISLHGSKVLANSQDVSLLGGIDHLAEQEDFMLRHTFVTTMLDAGVDLRDVQIAARHADPRTTMRYDRARKNLDRHPNYILAAYMASGT